MTHLKPTAFNQTIKIEFFYNCFLAQGCKAWKAETDRMLGSPSMITVKGLLHAVRCVGPGMYHHKRKEQRGNYI